MKDLKSNITTSDVVVGTTIIDRQGYESLTISLDVEDATTVKLEHGDDSGLSDAAEVGADFIIGQLVFATADGSPCTIGYNGNKRYVRPSYVSLVNGTAASITSDNSFAVSDLTGKTLIITATGLGAQTVTFGTATTALLAAEDINDQVVGLHASVVATDIVITTDAVGSLQTIALAGTATDLTWEAVVVGTGTNLTAGKGTAILGHPHLAPVDQS